MKLLRLKPIAIIASFGVILMIAGAGAVMSPYLNDTSFCLSCHEMNFPYQEYKQSRHFKNTSGVRVECNSCHIPQEMVPKLLRKVQAIREVYAHFAGVLDTQELFENERARMAKRLWAEMKASNSRECRSCHKQEAFIFSEFKKPQDAKRMQKGLKEKQTCIDCHKGKIHKMPNLSGGYKKYYKELTADAANLKISGSSTIYPLKIIVCYDGKDGNREGRVIAATKMSVLEKDGSWLKVRIDGWQQDGVNAMIYELQGKRVFSVALDKRGREKAKTLSTMTDPDTEQVWHKVSYETWVKSENVLDNLEKLWGYGAEMHGASCGSCHSLSPTNHFLANQWIGGLKDMKQYINLDKEEYLFLQKYLQMHALDVKKNKS